MLVVATVWMVLFDKIGRLYWSALGNCILLSGQGKLRFTLFTKNSA